MIVKKNPCDWCNVCNRYVLPNIEEHNGAAHNGNKYYVVK